MKKISLLAALGVVCFGLAGAVTPTFAASIASCQDDVTNSGAPGASEYSSFIDSDMSAIVAGLQQKGIVATNVSDWGGCLKADVVRKNGQVAQEFFDPTTLQRLHVNG